MRHFIIGLTLASISASQALASGSAEMQTVQITLKDHRYTPDVITVAAGQKVRIDIINRDATADDFESEALRVDRELKPHAHEIFVVGPLKPGRYPFKGELHAETAHGEVVAEAR